MPVAELDRALGDIDRVLLDSSSLIAFRNPHERTHQLAQHLLRRIARDDDPLRGYISVVSVTELLVRPIRTSQAEFTYMHSFLTSHPRLTVLPTDTVVAVEAATLRAAMRIALTDATVIAAGLLSGCQALVSNDAQWKQRGPLLFPQFRWIYLSDYL